jgi:hypothetical protein
VVVQLHALTSALDGGGWALESVWTRWQGEKYPSYCQESKSGCPSSSTVTILTELQMSVDLSNDDLNLQGHIWYILMGDVTMLWVSVPGYGAVSSAVDRFYCFCV